MTKEEMAVQEQAAKAVLDQLADKVSSADLDAVKAQFSELMDKKLAEANRLPVPDGEKAEKISKEAKQFVAGTPYTSEAKELFRLYLKTHPSQSGPMIQKLAGFAQKALGSYSMQDGAVLVPPETRAQLIVKLLNVVNVRKMATIITTKPGVEVNFPTMAFDVSDAWTQEGQTTSADTISNPFGKTSLSTHKQQHIITIPNQLIESAIINVESVLLDWYVEQIARSEENAFFNGNGIGKPKGLLSKNAAGNYILPTVNTSTSPALSATNPVNIADIIGLPYTIKQQYRMSADCGFIVPRYGIAFLRKATSSMGFLWSNNFTAVDGQPVTFAGYPIYETEYMTGNGFDRAAGGNTPTTGQPMALFGDFSKYWIADSEAVSILRLNELYAASDQTGYRIIKYTDGGPVLAEAFSLLISS